MRWEKDFPLSIKLARLHLLVLDTVEHFVLKEGHHATEMNVGVARYLQAGRSHEPFHHEQGHNQGQERQDRSKSKHFTRREVSGRIFVG